MTNMTQLNARSVEVRAERTKLKVALLAGDITLADALRAPACAPMTVAAVMAWQIQWGRVRIRKALNSVGLSEGRVCRDVTDRQVEALDAYVTPRNRRVWERR